MTESEAVTLDIDGKPIYIEPGEPLVQVTFSVNDPGLLDRFQQKWQLKVHNKARINEIIGTHSYCLP